MANHHKSWKPAPKPAAAHMTLDIFEKELKAKHPDSVVAVRGLDNGTYDIIVDGRAIPISNEKITSLTSIDALGEYINSLGVK